MSCVALRTFAEAGESGMRIVTSVLVLAIGGTCVAHAASLQSFDVPGQQVTCGWGIADDGTVAGNPVTLIGQPLHGNNSFTWRNGVFSYPKPAVPQGLVSLNGINSHGVIVGTDLVFPQGAESYQAEGFTYAAGQVTMLAIPGAINQTATGINDAGAIIGYYQMSGTGPTLGFEQVGSHIYTLDGGTGTTLPAATDGAGNVVAGTLMQKTGNGVAYNGFLYRNHQFTPIVYPGATDTFVLGMSRPNVLTGTYLIGSTTHGFVYRRGVYTTMDVRGASQTQIGGANVSGQFTGCYTDGKGTHGFVYTPH